MENSNSKEPVDQNKETVCDPGCDCNKPVSGNKTKIVVGLVVAIIAVGIFAYKITKPVSAVVTESTNDYASVANETDIKTTPLFAEKQNVPAVEVNQVSKKIYVGEYLDSINSLNKVAMNQDAVFILIPAKGKEPVKQETQTAMQGVQKTLKTSGINAGLYTLRTSAPDYQGIIKQIPAPAILVVCKGKGMSAVPGDATEEKLVQAFVAVSQATGGCGPSSAGCGPSTPDCK